MSAWTKIQHIDVPSPGQAAIEFTSIPQTFTDLRLVLSIRSAYNGVQTDGRVTFNGENSNKSGRLLYGQGSGAPAAGSYSNLFIWYPGALNTANIFSNIQIYIPNYTAATPKTTSHIIVNENNATFNYLMIFAGLWNNTAPISSITLNDNNSANWIAGSSATLYGITKGSSGGVTVS
jgi:hypothetical protein